MKIGKQAILLEDIGSEKVMEGADMCATILTLGPGQRVPWHYHSTITDVIVCLDGPVVDPRTARDSCVARWRTLRSAPNDRPLCLWSEQGAVPLFDYSRRRGIRQSCS